MGRKQMFFSSNIDWQGTVDNLKKAGVWHQVTRKGLIKVKLNKYNVVLLISPKGKIIVTYDTRPENLPLGVPQGTFKDVVLEVKETPRGGIKSIVTLDKILKDMLPLFSTTDGKELNLQFEHYNYFSSGWKDELPLFVKEYWKNMSALTKAYANLLEMASLLKRAVYDRKFRNHIKIIFEKYEKHMPQEPFAPWDIPWAHFLLYEIKKETSMV